METQTKPVTATETIPVTVENFIRAESDMYLSVVALKEGGFGKFEHHRALSPVDAQTIIRMNRDTIYSAAVFDLDAGPVTITMPDPGTRFMSLQTISEDEYSLPTRYEPGPYTIAKEKIGTRYVLVGVRTLVNPMIRRTWKKCISFRMRSKLNNRGVREHTRLPGGTRLARRKCAMH